MLAIFTTDTNSNAETIIARYANRWPIEVAIAGAKQLLGIGQARNRLQRAVERTVPLSFCVYILITDRHDWSTAEVVAGYRSQSDAEFGFRKLKDPTSSRSAPCTTSDTSHAGILT